MKTFIKSFWNIKINTTMYKTRNTRTGNRMRGTRWIGGMLYSGKCRQTFLGISLKIPGNVSKRSGKFSKTFPVMSLNIPRNVAKHSEECPQTFQRMSSNIPGNIAKNSGEWPESFRKKSPTIPGKALKHSGECCQTFRGMFFIYLSIYWRLTKNSCISFYTFKMQ